MTTEHIKMLGTRVFTKLGPWQNLGDTLLIGEGNLSFALSLLTRPYTFIDDIVATTYESDKNLEEETIKNARRLKYLGATVRHGIDATKLEKYHRNPNHILIRKFFRSAAQCLNRDGKIMTTLVDSPHHEGAFKIEEAARFANCYVDEIHPFAPEDFSGYSHINTNDGKSAIRNYNKFTTWIIRPHT